MNYNEIKQLQDKFHKLICDEAELRPLRSEWVEMGVGRGRELAWILKERQAMFELVNHERNRLGKDSINLKILEKIEQDASGHFDYAWKFALGCVDLVLAG